MSKTIFLQKATRIEGNANIRIEIEGGSVKTARFQLNEFRGFEKFVKGRRVEFVPHLVSRICGLCSAAHQVASLKAIENAIGLDVPESVSILREIVVLGEWISSHALSYYFLTMPDFVGSSGGIFELMKSHPEITNKAFSLRKAGQRIVTILGKRAVHPVSMGVGRFLIQPTPAEISDVHQIALNVKEITEGLIAQASKTHLQQKNIVFPPDQQINFLTCETDDKRDVFKAYSRSGDVTAKFETDDFEVNISEMSADWTYAKFPYITKYGFPAGIMLVGPLSRSFIKGGILDDDELSGFALTEHLRKREALTLESYDTCRLLEIFWASKRIIRLLENLDISETASPQDLNLSGQGIGVVEAPRGLLVHSYVINRGCIERIRLLVATQFNNAYINLIIRDLAGSHLNGENLSREGERLIGRCVRIFDPCISCTTH